MSSNSPGNPEAKRLVVFVHGFGSSAKCWSKLISKLQTDPRIKAAFDLECYEYPTKWFNLRLGQRIPRLEETASGLGAFLEQSRLRDYPDVTLVGHSQGGLVIQKYLAMMLSARRGYELERIRQVILMATPNLGSTLLAPARNILFRIFDNPQERALRVLNPEIHDLLEFLGDRVANAMTRDADCWPIPVRCFWGQQDDIVPEASARGPYTKGAALPGDHFSVLEPNTQDHYNILAEALLEPLGHKNFFEVGSYEVEVRVEPLPEDFQQEMAFGSEGRRRTIRCDNRAHIIRRVTFSRRNCCTRLFELRYRTRGDGLLLATTSHRNEAPASAVGRYNETGTEFTFQFTPRPKQTYALHLEVYKGFDPGQRNFHTHLDLHTHIRHLLFRVDLSAYLAAGFRVEPAPQLHFLAQDRATCEECNRILDQPPVPCAKLHRRGIWEWRLSDLRGGVLTVQWDVVKAASAASSHARGA